MLMLLSIYLIVMSSIYITATIENNQKMLNLEAEKLNAETLTDVRHHTYWTGGFSFWISWTQVLSSNALAIKNKQPNQ